MQPTFIDQNDPALKQRVHEELAHYDEYQRQILPALIYSKLSTSDNAGDGINLINVVDECLSESLKHYKLSSRENDQRNAKDGSSAVGISETSTNIQVVGNYEYSNGFPFQNTGLSNTPRFVGNQDLDAEAVSSGVPELGFGWNSEYDSSVSGPIPLGISACEVPEYALDQTTGEDGNTI